MKIERIFTWKSNASESHGISAEDAFNELEKIKRKNFGNLTAELIVSASRSKEHPLHDFFNWDDKAAAELYRNKQARDLLRGIEVKVITDGGEKRIRAYEVIERNEDQKGSFKSVMEFDSKDIDYVKGTCKKNLIFWKDKISIYSELSVVQKHIENAISELELLEK